MTQPQGLTKGYSTNFVKLHFQEVECLLQLLEAVTDVRDLTEQESAARARLELMRSAMLRKKLVDSKG